MTSELLRCETDEDLIRRLPLPLAQLFRRSMNAKTPLERHHAAYYLWEASLKLLGSVAIVEYARLDDHDPQLKQRLQTLARPSLGHWWEFVRRLLPVLADSSDEFTQLRDFLLGRNRSDLPRVAGLDALLVESLDGTVSTKSTVQLTELLDRLVQYRNAELGHGAAGQKPTAFYAKMGETLLAAGTELLSRIDLLAGGTLVHIEDVRRLTSGQWLVERYELTGETPRRLESQTYSEDQASLLPRPGHVLLLPSEAAESAASSSLHPLVLFESETGQAFFLNSRRKKMRVEYLCYTTGDIVQRDSLAGEHRELLTQILGINVTDEAVSQWEARSQADEPDGVGGDDTDTSAPRTLGDYELISRIGQGGMGAVYRAWQPSLGKQVALKTLLRSGDPKAEARFAREIRALGRVEHPNLVKVFTSGSHGEQWFYTMELIEGADLATVCDQLGGSDVRSLSRVNWQRAVSSACEKARESEHPLSDDPALEPAGTSTGLEADATSLKAGTAAAGRGYIERAVEIIRQTALAAQTLHSAGVIHRDIKPGNIMLTPEGDRAVLMDLGLAQMADESEGRLTRTRQFVGTLRYASPEQVLSVPLDTRSDVYSLGATLWELLTLQPLFGATEQTPTPELMLKIQSTDPVPPRRINPEVPEDLEAIVIKCLEKDRVRRYASAQDLADDLFRWQHGEPVQAQPPTLKYLLGRYVRRHRAKLATIAAMVLAAFVTVASLGAYAELQRRNAVELLIDMHTVAGVVAAERERPTEAVLWFAEAAALAPAGSDRQQANQVRFQAYSRELVKPVRAIRYDSAQVAELKVNPNGGHAFILDREKNLVLWDFLSEKTSQSLTDEATCAAWHPTGDRLVAGTSRGELLIFPFPPVAPPSRIGFGEPVRCLRFSEGGSLLAVGGHKLRVWDSQSSAFLKGEGAHPQPLKSLDFDSRSAHVVTSCVDQQARVFEIRDGVLHPEPSFGPTPHIANPRIIGSHGCSAFFTADGKLVTLPGLTKLVVHDLRSGMHLSSYSLPDTVITAIAPHPRQSAFVAVGKSLGAFFHGANFDIRSEFAGHSREIPATAFSTSGDLFATGGTDRLVRVWAATNSMIAHATIPHQYAIHSVEFAHPREDELITMQEDGLIRLWKLPASRSRYHVPQNHIQFLAVSGDGRRMMPTGKVHHPVLTSTRVFDTATGEPLGPILNPNGLLNWSIFSPDGREAVLISSSPGHKQRQEQFWGQEPGVISFWDWRTGGETRSRIQTPSEPLAAEFTVDGSILLVVCARGEVMSYDVATGNERFRSRHNGRTWMSWHYPRKYLLMNPDGKQFATLGLGNEVCSWDASNGRLLYRVRHADRVRDACYSADGRWLATGSDDKTVRLIDTQTGREVGPNLLHPNRVFSVSFNSAGDVLLTGSADRGARAWNWRAATLVAPVIMHSEEVTQAFFMQDERWVRTLTLDGYVHHWERSTGRRILPSQRLVGRGAEGSAYGSRFSQEVGNLFIATNKFGINAFDYPEFSVSSSPRSGQAAATLLTLAEIYSGQHLEGGNAINFTSDEWLERWRRFTTGQTRGPTTVADARAAGTPNQSLKAADIKACQNGLEHALRLRDWRKAAEESRHLLKLVPDDHWTWYRHASLLAGLNDFEEYRRHCEAILNRFATSADSTIARRTAQCCSYVASAVDDFEQMKTLTDRSAKNDPRHYALAMTYGMVHYRQGNHDEALEWLEKSLKTASTVDSQRLTRLFLAATYHQLNDHPRAKQWLENAEKIGGPWLIDDGSILLTQWYNLLFCRAVHREVAALIRGPQLKVRDGIQGRTVSLMTTSANATVRYTLDGSQPTDVSPVFAESVDLKPGEIIQVRMFYSSGRPSAVSVHPPESQQTKVQQTKVPGVTSGQHHF